MMSFLRLKIGAPHPRLKGYEDLPKASENSGVRERGIFACIRAPTVRETSSATEGDVVWAGLKRMERSVAKVCVCARAFAFVRVRLYLYAG